MRPADHFAIVEALLSAHSGNPTQAELRKAISIAYYAVFYALCLNSADCLIGIDLSDRAWRQAFRALDHGFAKRQCKNQQVMAGFSPGIQLFATNFVALQEKRHAADYDPSITLDIVEVQACLDDAKQAVAALAAASEQDHCDFAAWVTLRHRP